MKVKLLKKLRKRGRNQINIHSVTKSDGIVVGMSIGYDDDIDQALSILNEIVNNHPLVLKNPESTIKVHTLADSSVNFICRPWTKSDKYWDVYWDITSEVKRRFDAEGVSFPFPQQDVHLYLNDAEAVQSVSANRE